MTYDGKTPWSEWYEAYLKSSEWAARRGAVIARAGGLCEGCRRTIATQVHHRPEAYKQLRAVGRELLCDLVALCDTCHSEVAHWDKRSDEEPARAEEPSPALSSGEELLAALLLFDPELRTDSAAAYRADVRFEEVRDLLQRPTGHGWDRLPAEVRSSLERRIAEVSRTMQTREARQKALRDAVKRMRFDRLNEESAAKLVELKAAQSSGVSEAELQRLLVEHQRISKRRQLLLVGEAA